MKRIGHLHEQLLDEKLILKALMDSCKGKGNRRIVQRIKLSPRKYVLEIKEMIAGGFLPSEPKRFQRQDPGTGKVRDICSVPFYPDQVIHRLCVNIMKEAITKGMDRYCVGCVPKRGCSAGMKGVRKTARSSRKRRIWVFKGDIHHFYASINREKLFEILRRKIKDTAFLCFLWNITTIEPKGLAIGVYSSPWLANLYLEHLDHVLKEDCGIRFITRNVDDYVWMDGSRRRLLKAKARADEELSRLGLEFKPDWRIYHLDGNDVDYVGYRISQKGQVRIRKRTWRKLRRDCLIAEHHHLSPKRARSILSRMGFAMNSNGRTIFRKYLKKETIILAKSIAWKE